MDIQERSYGTTDKIDIPIPSEEMLQSMEPGDLVRVEEIPRDADHFSANYRRC